MAVERSRDLQDIFFLNYGNAFYRRAREGRSVLKGKVDVRVNLVAPRTVE